MRDRAEKVGVVVKPTPDGLREAVASRVLAADDRRGAACLLHKHQKEVQQTVARAEKREVRLRDMHALRERLRIQRRQLWKTFNMQSDDTDGDAPGLCVEVGAGERLEFELETRELEQGMIARLSDKERRLFNWLSLRKMQWRQMRQRRENEARRREEEARMEARRQQVASAAVAAAAAGDVNLPSGLLAGFEFSVSLVSAKLKEFDEEEKAGEPLGYRSLIRNNRMRGWGHLPQAHS